MHNDASGMEKLRILRKRKKAADGSAALGFEITP
jgi:hypothetical protein